MITFAAAMKVENSYKDLLVFQLNLVNLHFHRKLKKSSIEYCVIAQF